MTPAERDEVRAIAADNAKRRGHADDCDCDRCRHDRAILRYVPAGAAAHHNVRPLPVESDLPPALRRVVAIVSARLQPDVARATAHALHAAADAAEETTR